MCLLLVAILVMNLARTVVPSLLTPWFGQISPVWGHAFSALMELPPPPPPPLPPTTTTTKVGSNLMSWLMFQGLTNLFNFLVWAPEDMPPNDPGNIY